MDALERLLAQAQALGFLGPGPVEVHISHSRAFVAAWEAVEPRAPARVLDLGSGGGIPGLALLATWPAASFVFLDAQQRRIRFLQEALEALGVSERATTALGRAEDLARGPLREAFDLVVARGFGSPAVTAECGARFLRPGGLLEVAEPPGAPSERWPAAGAESLGLVSAAVVTTPAAVRALRLAGPVADRFPRRTGVPAKRPLWY